MSEKVYTYEEALVASQEYFNGNDLAARVFLDKYAMRNRLGEFVEDTPHKMHDRLAHEFAKIDEKYGQDYQERYDIYRQAIDKFARIVPQGSPMAAVGNKYQLMSASNCVVIASSILGKSLQSCISAAAGLVLISRPCAPRVHQ